MRKDHLFMSHFQRMKNRSAALLDDLYHPGGNSVGARPKIFVNYNEHSEAFTLNPEKESAPWIKSRRDVILFYSFKNISLIIINLEFFKKHLYSSKKLNCSAYCSSWSQRYCARSANH